MDRNLASARCSAANATSWPGERQGRMRSWSRILVGSSKKRRSVARLVAGATLAATSLTTVEAAANADLVGQVSMFGISHDARWFDFLTVGVWSPPAATLSQSVRMYRIGAALTIYNVYAIRKTIPPVTFTRGEVEDTAR